MCAIVGNHVTRQRLMEKLKSSQDSLIFRSLLMSFWLYVASRPLPQMQVWTHSLLQTREVNPRCSLKDPKGLWEIADVDVGREIDESFQARAGWPC